MMRHTTEKMDMMVLCKRVPEYKRVPEAIPTSFIYLSTYRNVINMVGSTRGTKDCRKFWCVEFVEQARIIVLYLVHSKILFIYYWLRAYELQLPLFIYVLLCKQNLLLMALNSDLIGHADTTLNLTGKTGLIGMGVEKTQLWKWGSGMEQGCRYPPRPVLLKTVW